MGPRWGQYGEKIRKKRQHNKKVGGTNLRPHIFSEKVANMAPTWLPKWSQHGQKINAKIDHFSDASWNRFLDGFWWILDTRMEPSWYQNGSKNRFLRKDEKTHLELAR